MSKQEKEARLRAALSHKEADRVPISDFFWAGFVENASRKWGGNLDLYSKFDLDYIVISPNMDPIIRDFEIIKQQGDDIWIRTGFGATVLRRADLPMPHFESFAVREPEEMDDYIIEPADDKRRFYRSGDDQMNCLGDRLLRNIPCWIDRVDSCYKDIPVFSAICEGFEYLWRCVGTENSLYWMMLEPELFERFIGRIGDFLCDLVECQIREANGKLSGMYIWGDVAYVNGMMFSPEIWRQYFKPITRRLIEICHKAGLMVIYHGCGNATKIYEDMIEIGLDAYNPLEAKAGLNVAELKKDYKGRLAFVGNIDVRELESGDKARIKKEVLGKLPAAVGGGWVCQSDHSITEHIAPDSYAYVVELIRDYGQYPLDMERIEAALKED
ncbi:MAG: uroporphyrinogen decarboxylase family protein [Oscillospiraceae bacterium]|nr:uroporphyrinogen decarboxylase family protein [Oscillospiraceae bacterium]